MSMRRGAGCMSFEEPSRGLQGPWFHYRLVKLRPAVAHQVCSGTNLLVAGPREIEVGENIFVLTGTRPLRCPGVWKIDRASARRSRIRPVGRNQEQFIFERPLASKEVVLARRTEICRER